MHITLPHTTSQGWLPIHHTLKAASIFSARGLYETCVRGWIVHVCVGERLSIINRGNHSRLPPQTSLKHCTSPSTVLLSFIHTIYIHFSQQPVASFHLNYLSEVFHCLMELQCLLESNQICNHKSKEKKCNRPWQPVCKSEF